jgi:hypothetical protein
VPLEGAPPSDPNLACLTGTVPDGGCAYPSDCLFNETCVDGNCITAPSCAAPDGGACPVGTQQETYELVACASSCPGEPDMQLPFQNDPDAGFDCPQATGGTICFYSRCLRTCGQYSTDCPAGMICVEYSDGSACFPFSPETAPSEIALKCVGAG